MQTQQISHFLITLMLTGIMLVLLVSTTSAQRPSLGGLQTQIDANTATGSANASDISTNESDITLNSDAICELACGTGIDVSFCACPKTVFVTSQTYSANLGNLVGADAKCQGLADTVGLPGTYLAWLSNGTTAEQPRDRFTQSTTPYVRTDGVEVAADWTDLIDGEIDHPISIDELGNPAGTGSPAWTNTNSNGSRGSMHCGNWLSTSGNAAIGGPNRTTGEWSRILTQTRSCGLQAKLYCVEQ